MADTRWLRQLLLYIGNLLVQINSSYNLSSSIALTIYMDSGFDMLVREDLIHSLEDNCQSQNASIVCSVHHVSSDGLLLLTRYKNKMQQPYGRVSANTSLALLSNCSKCQYMETLPPCSKTDFIWCAQSSVFRSCTSILQEDYAFSALLEKMNFRKIVLLKDSLSALGLASSQVISNSVQESVFLSDKDPLLFRQQLARLANQHGGNFLFSADINMTAEILQQISRTPLLGPDFNWLIDLRHDIDSIFEKHITSYMEPGDNLAVVTLNSQWKNLSCKKMNALVTDITEYTIWRTPYQVEEDIGRHTILEVKKCVSSCDLANSPLTSVATVDSRGQVQRFMKVFPQQFQGFHQRKFRIVTKEYPPFVKKIRDKESGAEIYTGLCIKLLEALASRLNFTYELFDVVDGQFGVINESGVWNGIIGTVHRQEADFGVNGLSITLDRETVVDFTISYWEEPTVVLISLSNKEPKIFSLFKPLQWLVWVLTIFLIFCASVGIYIITWLSQRLCVTSDPMASFWACLWYCYGVFLQQGGFHEPTTLAARVVSGAWWIIAIVIYAIYTGNLIAFLTIARFQMPFNNLEGMVSQNEYSYGVEKGIVQHMLFKNAESGVYKSIWQGISSSSTNLVSDLTEGVNRTAREKFAFIGEKTALHAATGDNCDLHFIREEFFKSSFGFAMKEGWPYTKYFNQVIMSLVESGFVARWMMEFWPQDACQWSSTSLQAKSLGLEDISGNFGVLLLGLVLATSALAVECVFSRSSGRQHFAHVQAAAQNANKQRLKHDDSRICLRQLSSESILLQRISASDMEIVSNGLGLWNLSKPFEQVNFPKPVMDNISLDKDTNSNVKRRQITITV